jgi:hypothetical protein
MSAEESGTWPSQISEADIKTLHSSFPILANLLTDFIRGLLKLERSSFTQLKWEKFRDAGEKLASNSVDLGLSITSMEDGAVPYCGRLLRHKTLAYG